MNAEADNPFPELIEATLAELQSAMNTGQLTARRLVEMYLRRIDALDRRGPALRSLLEINPDALAIAEELDQERKVDGPRGPLHGIPLLIKDNIATVDRMQTTAGSLALLGSRPPRDAFVIGSLRAAGAILLAKTNMSEWANFRSTSSSSGWSGRGGQARNPYVLDRSPSGSSSGSATAIAANLAVASLGSETDGSILSPASANAVVGVKPTLGLVSRAGVIPIAHSQDTLGPLARTVADAAVLLGALTGIDSRDPATQASAGNSSRDYTRFLDPHGLRGARIGVARQVYFGYSPAADAITEAAIERMGALGATIVDNADIASAQQMAASHAELTVLLYEFKADLNAYLAELHDSQIHSLADIITFNTGHADEELQYFAQELLLQAEASGPLDDPRYLDAIEENRRLSHREGVDAVMTRHQLDALVMPTSQPAWPIDLVNGDHVKGGSSQPASVAGYPAINVPAGYVRELPVGITFMGRAFSEPTLIKLAYAFEQASHARRPPRFLASTP